MFGFSSFSQFAFSDFNGIVSAVGVDAYHPPLSTPIRRRPPLPAADQQFIALVKADPFPEAVTVDRWWEPLGEPKRFLRALPARHQQFIALVSADPFPEAV